MLLTYFTEFSNNNNMTTSKLLKQTASLRKEDIKKDWLLIDAKDIVLGRLATNVSNILRGKHKPTYTPHAVSYTHLRAHETPEHLVCRLLLEKKK